MLQDIFVHLLRQMGVSFVTQEDVLVSMSKAAKFSHVAVVLFEPLAEQCLLLHAIVLMMVFGKVVLFSYGRAVHKKTTAKRKTAQE